MYVPRRTSCFLDYVLEFLFQQKHIVNVGILIFTSLVNAVLFFPYIFIFVLAIIHLQGIVPVPILQRSDAHFFAIELVVLVETSCPCRTS